MEAYKHESEEFIQRFLERKISFSQCVTSLNAAFADILPRSNSRELDSLRVLLMAADDRLREEMSRRAREQIRRVRPGANRTGSRA
jgi:hypothetical protein